MDSYHQGQRPTELDCDFCGETFALDRARTGRMQRSDTKWCPDCGRSSPEVMRFRRYKVTKAQYDAAMLRGCELCGAKKPLHVDHDHACCPANKYSCGQCVRGFICGPCNRGLGLFFDNGLTASPHTTQSAPTSDQTRIGLAFGFFGLRGGRGDRERE